MTTARYLVGDVFEQIATMPDNSVDLVMTSPPFLALRSYLPPDHPDKGREIGSEVTPADFIDTMLDVVEACERVLAPHGSICFEIGDTYSGASAEGSDQRGSARYPNGRGMESLSTYATKNGTGWPQAKSLTFMPQLFAASLAYGRNLLRPERTIEPWRVRNLVAWVRPNPPVGALGDKVRPATSYLTWACKSTKRWFDLDAVRTDHKYGDYEPTRGDRLGAAERTGTKGGGDIGKSGGTIAPNPAGAPPLDWWKISPGGYQGSHYAVFPPELCRIPIEASCPRRVCTTCGDPSRRETGGATLDAYRGSDRSQTIKAVAKADAAGLTDEHVAAVRATGPNDTGKAVHVNNGAGHNSERTQQLAAEAKDVLGGYFREFVTTGNASITTTGWTTCGCPGTDGIRLDGYHTGAGWRSGVVLDPFAGSGTTLMAATGLSRAATGIDIDERNVELARERLGMFLEVDGSVVVDGGTP